MKKGTKTTTSKKSVQSNKTTLSIVNVEETDPVIKKPVPKPIE
jgi:hypothetical protein